ncbi:MAG TPA: hypothetical protein VFE96_06870 [Candidatus Bathyarchaeia archaeon]|jgi:hypothetical protein|nr:hypothetical protein [Candidatus Bathyarchaeia archaeon]
MELATRYKIVGVEVVGFGLFVLLLLFLEYTEAQTNPVVNNFSWVWAIVGITLILVGLEQLSLNRKLFRKPARVP